MDVRTTETRVPKMGDVVNVTDGFVKKFRNAAPKMPHNTTSFINSNTNNNIKLLPRSSISSASSLSAAVLQWLQQHPNSQLPATMNTSDTEYDFLTNLTYTNSTIYIHDTADPNLEDDEIHLEHAPQLSKSALIKVYVLSIMALLSLLGNVLTMWNIYKTRLARRNSRHSWSAIYYLIFHLSIADLLVTGFCIIGEAAWYFTVQWLADDFTCKLVKLFQMFSLYLSTYVLVLIGIDRWIAVKYPMKSLNMSKRCYHLLGGTYILSLILSSPQFFIFRVARGPFIEEFYQCVTHGFYTEEWQEQLYATFTLVFTFLLPLCILFGTYMSTFRTISNSEKIFEGLKLAGCTNRPSSKTNRQRLIHKAKMKSLRISVVIIFAFLICWTPYNVMMLIFMFWNPDKRFGEDLQSAIFFFGMSNSVVNPLIYGAFHLCSAKRKTNKRNSNNNGANSLNRGDSNRTPSMLTAVTQVDVNGRQVRSFRHCNYYRSISTNSTHKENIGLLQTTTSSSVINLNASTATPSLTRKAVSIRSPHPNQRALVIEAGRQKSPSNQCKSTTLQYHNHSTEIIKNYNSISSCSSMSHSDDSGDRLGIPVGAGGCSVCGVTGVRGVGGINDVCKGGGGESVVLSLDNKRGGGTCLKKCASSSLNGENRSCSLSQITSNGIGLQSLLSGTADRITNV